MSAVTAAVGAIVTVVCFFQPWQTLLAHRDRWVRESAPTSSAMTGLDTAEAALYDDLVTDRFGSAVRLEQERIEWEWALERLRSAGW